MGAVAVLFNTGCPIAPKTTIKETREKKRRKRKGRKKKKFSELFGLPRLREKEELRREATCRREICHEDWSSTTATDTLSSGNSRTNAHQAERTSP